METNKEIKKAFALEQIRPYYKDRNLCGFENGKCVYLSEEGKMCVVGKNLIDPSHVATKDISAYDVLTSDQIELKIESRNILTIEEWAYLQTIHDNIANNTLKEIPSCCICLNLFTYEELIA